VSRASRGATKKITFEKSIWERKSFAQFKNFPNLTSFSGLPSLQTGRPDELVKKSPKTRHNQFYVKIICIFPWTKVAQKFWLLL
jgi:hypothetical protein